MKTIKELQAARTEKREAVADIENKLNSFDETLTKRELTDEEKKQQREAQNKLGKAQREYQAACRDLQDAIADEQAKGVQREAKKTTGTILRELLKSTRDGHQSREVVLGSAGDSGIVDSGAVNLTIHDLIPTLNEGLGLPGGLHIVTGVTGDEIWPVGLDDAEVEEVGENVALTEQDLHFDQIKPTSHRTGIAVDVSNAAIDNASFDLLSYVQQKFTLAVRKYLAKKLYSQAAFTGNKGPFSGATSAGTITLNATAFANILKAVATFTDKGYDTGDVCLVMDASTEAELKALPKAAGQGGFIIDGGKCAGYDYVVSHFINTELDTDNKTLKSTTDRYIGIGLFPYEAVQQHGEVRMTVDSVSKAVAIKNVTALVLNTAWSFTDLSVKTTTNGKKNTTTTAFALYKVAEAGA